MHKHCDEDPIECSYEAFIAQLYELKNWLVIQETGLKRSGTTSAEGAALAFRNTLDKMNQLGI